MKAIRVQELTRAFNGLRAVDGISFAVEPGEVFGFLGPNGAGKTTTIRMLMGLLRPNRGTARVLGADLWTAPREVRARVAYVSQALQIHAGMTPAARGLGPP